MMLTLQNSANNIQEKSGGWDTFLVIDNYLYPYHTFFEASFEEDIDRKIADRDERYRYPISDQTQLSVTARVFSVKKLINQF